MDNVQETKNKMIAVKEAQAELIDLNSTSRVSIWNLLLFIVAFCFQDLRKYFDTHLAEVNYALDNQKSGTLPWYRDKVLNFQYGFDLITDNDKFENGSATSDEIEASKVIKYCAVNNGDAKGSIVIKIAGENSDNELSPLPEEVQIAVEEFLKEISYAGDEQYISVINYIADLLFLNFKIYIDPLVLTTNGVSIRNGNKPVEDALLEFMKELPFNGELILQSLVDKIQAVEGVRIAHLIEAKSSWLDAQAQTHGVATQIDVKRIPESGYFKINNFDGIEYVV